MKVILEERIGGCEKSGCIDGRGLDERLKMDMFC